MDKSNWQYTINKRPCFVEGKGIRGEFMHLANKYLTKAESKIIELSSIAYKTRIPIPNPKWITVAVAENILKNFCSIIPENSTLTFENIIHRIDNKIGAISEENRYNFKKNPKYELFNNQKSSNMNQKIRNIGNWSSNMNEEKNKTKIAKNKYFIIDKSIEFIENDTENGDLTQKEFRKKYITNIVDIQQAEKELDKLQKSVHPSKSFQTYMKESAHNFMKHELIRNDYLRKKGSTHWNDVKHDVDNVKALTNEEIKIELEKESRKGGGKTRRRNKSRNRNKSRRSRR